MIELPTPIVLDVFIQPAKLTNLCQASSLGGLKVVAAGTGRIYYHKRTDDTQLREAIMEIMPSENCTRRTSKYGVSPNTAICAIVGQDGLSTYFGDSGICIVCNFVRLILVV